ncbi:DNA excision repair protein ercc-8 [Anaeramoeba flamelloides]|uniref:DNA excision repair protein ercc-8 n=1 Tax=Anaeramoeba flamelloides TaxID=1746091 RepID=A0AAV7YVU3_9EUKA|nr:DNA excision repair protein ercc-8 [Anaeramoeba flamelloides]
MFELLSLYEKLYLTNTNSLVEENNLSSQVERFKLSKTLMVPKGQKIITTMSLSKDEQYLLTGSSNGRINLFNTYPQRIFLPQNKYLNRKKKNNKEKEERVGGVSGEEQEEENYDDGDGDEDFDILSEEEENEQEKFNTCRNLLPKSKIHCHKYLISCVLWHPFETNLYLSSGYDGNVFAWDGNRQEVAESYNFKSHVNALSISSIPSSSQKSLVAVATTDYGVRIIDLVSGSSTQSLRGHTGKVSDVKFSPVDEYVLVSSSEDKTIRLWDLRYPSCPYKFLGSKAMPKEQQEKIKLINTYDDRLGKIPRMIALVSETNCLCFADHNKLVTSSYGSGKHTMHVWDMTSGEQLDTVFEDAHNVSKLRLQIDCKHNRVIHPGKEGDINIYNVDTGGKPEKILSAHFGQVNCMMFTNDFTTIYSSGADDQIFVWDSKQAQDLIPEEEESLILQQNVVIPENEIVLNQSHYQQQQQESNLFDYLNSYL